MLCLLHVLFYISASLFWILKPIDFSKCFSLKLSEISVEFKSTKDRLYVCVKVGATLFALLKLKKKISKFATKWLYLKTTFVFCATRVLRYHVTIVARNFAAGIIMNFCMIKQRKDQLGALATPSRSKRRMELEGLLWTS